jgi:hypothetical protein
MNHLKKSVMAAALALVVACAGAVSASATTIFPASTVFVLTSTNSSLAVSGGGTASCSDSTISGTTPASGGVTTVSTKINLSYSNCNAFGFAATVTVNASCAATGASPLDLNVMYNSTTSIAATVTVTSGCAITINVPLISCTVTVSGEQTIGNSTSGTGGIGILNGNSSFKTVFNLNNATVPTVVSSGGGFGCPTPGHHTGTLSGAYVVTTPSTNPGILVSP